MKMSARDRYILIVLPALFTLAAYVWFYGRPASRMVDELRSQANKAETEAPTAKQSSLEIANAESKLRGAKEQLEKMRQQSSTKVHVTTGNPVRIVQRVSEILTANRLQLVRTSPATLDQAAAPGHFWCFELYGTYPEMLKALSALANAPENVVASEIEMSPVDVESESESAEGAFKWLLTLRI